MGKNIVLGVTGSIAAYKSADIVSGLAKMGHNVVVVMTKSATELMAPLTLATLSKNKVCVDMFLEKDYKRIAHIDLARESDLILVAPATYNIIGKAACGIADDLLSTIIAAAPPEKVIFAPAMNENMYNNPINIENIERLTRLGYRFIEPDEGMLACGIVGKGRLRNVADILEIVDDYFYDKPLLGKRVLITAGATREYLDPIRFISNTSSGLMGMAIAKACKSLGAAVTVVLANSELSACGIDIVKVDTVAQMFEAAVKNFRDADLVFAAAAVSDFKPKEYSKSKIKKSGDKHLVEFELNTDILAELGKQKENQFLVGFAAESENLFENAKGKLEKKKLDMIVANHLENFSSEVGKVWMISKDETIELKTKPKEKLAYDIVRTVLDRWC